MSNQGHRHTGRAYALQVLYARDVEGAHDASQMVSDVANAFEGELDPIDDQARSFAEALVQGVTTSGAQVDDTITQASRNWRLDRMARVDRNILRLATCELMTMPQTPVRVVINEAVELAKEYGTTDSAAFVNGVLDRIAKLVGRSAQA